MIRKYKQHLGGNDEGRLQVSHVREEPDILSIRAQHTVLFIETTALVIVLSGIMC